MACNSLVPYIVKYVCALWFCMFMCHFQFCTVDMPLVMADGPIFVWWLTCVLYLLLFSMFLLFEVWICVVEVRSFCSNCLNWLSRWCDVEVKMSCVEFVCTVILILLSVCVFYNTVHICKLWVINYCISSIEHNVFDVSVCGPRECAVQLTSLFCWHKASCQWVVGACCFEISTLLLRWYGAISQKNETSFAGLPCADNVRCISKRICYCESYSNCMAVMLVKFVSLSCPKQHCTVAPYLLPFNSLASSCLAVTVWGQNFFYPVPCWICHH